MRGSTKNQPHITGDDENNRRFQERVAAAAQKGLDASDTTGEKRVSVAVITAGLTSVLSVLGASADGLEILKPSELEWVLTTGAVVLAAIILILFAVLRVTRLSKQETAHLRTALTAVLDAVNEQLKSPGKEMASRRAVGVLSTTVQDGAKQVDGGRA
jgi:cytochrome c biogenesis protein CcdA